MIIGGIPGVMYAQNSIPSKRDADKTAIDTSIKKTANSVLTKYAAPIQTKASIPLNQAKQLSAATTAKVKQVNDALNKKLDAVKKPSVTFNLSVEEAFKYQPAPTSLIVDPAQKFVNNVYLRGTIQAFGIPLNLNYSNDHTAGAGPDLGGLNNDLFKLDFNPAQFAGIFKSDIQQYYDLRRNAFSGLDMATYARNTVQQKIKEETTAISGKANNSLLSQYLSDPAKVSQLLNMNEEQIRQKLTAIAQTEAKKESPVKDLNPGNLQQSVETLAQRQLAQEQQSIKAGALKELSGNNDLQQYLKQPGNIKALQGMNEQQIVQRLSAAAQSATPPSNKEDYTIFNIVPGLDIAGYVRRIMAERSMARDEAVKDMANKMLLARQSGKTLSPAEVLQTNAGQNAKPPIDQNALNKEVSAIANTITGMKSTLQSQGIDVNKMLQIQQLMDQHGGSLPPTEMAARLLDRKPANGLQTLFTKIQALKIGAFGNQVPGNTQGQDMFLQGTHVTFKLGNTPITAGYSNNNDISTGKDVAYQSSVYSSPKTITYLGATMNRGVFGHVKISVASSFGTGVNNTAYSTTSSASDNVAITMSKEMNMGRLGNVTFDVSKSTTLYNNNYQVGSDVLLAKKSGINLNTNNDLFEAVGLGLTHHLDIQEIGFSDNVYYNYSGMGYQNPGNNGSGGARMKLGGSVRKSFYKNKLILNLRTDLRNTPISYTTNDQWKNYQIQLDSRYNVSKKFNMSFKYTTNGTDKQIDNISTPVYSFQKIQVDGNINYKIGKNYTVSHFSIGKQDFTNSYVSASGGSMILVNYTQSMVLNRNTLTANILYNKELSSLQLLGNLLNSDLSYTYQLFRKVSMSSGLTYLNNTGIASQAGIRQSIQLMANNHFDLGSYIDIRKNMITPLYPDLYAACRAELSLKYHLKN
jgi:hypothetical protein